MASLEEKSEPSQRNKKRSCDEEFKENCKEKRRAKIQREISIENNMTGIAGADPIP